MDILESVKLALEGLRSNKMRSFLTMLGIIIGISSVISIMTIGRAMSDSVSKSFDSLGNTNIFLSVSPRSGSQDYDTMATMQDTDYMTDEMLDALKERFPSEIKSIALDGPSKSGFVRDGRKKANISLNSVNEGTKDSNNIKLQAGRFIEEKDLQSNRSVAVISDKVVKKIFNNSNEEALGNEITVYLDDKMEVFSVIGIYKFEQQSFGGFGGAVNSDDVTTSTYIPLTTGKNLLSTEDTEDGYRFVTLSASSSEILKTLSTEVADFFNNTYYKNNDKFEIQSQSIESITDEVNKTLGTVKLAIGAIAAISLLVGGIGVMNILLVSVTERTREIGIRKALGATNRDIKSQFIIESIIICIIGGLLGVLLGTTIGFAGSSLMKMPTFPSLLSIIIAVGFSMFIGIFFGYYPANKAAQLDPIDALRYE
ncbi:ABC transporter permease [Peptoniphilus stercorisuis]|uniref:ABC transport system permease protein n=1 Tax=Peptoniphilus stercorisuis TaxID=1436965 RepID=A0ABS4K9Y8_9FIRM|nr:ABC transporter permease [Peptoniphilus stercorisuis]MBP2024596.1 putative ABC transport system permease protein [Peptoniphilus stercorisuis]